MPVAGHQPDVPVPADTVDHQRSFRRRVFLLLAGGYRKLDASSYQDSKEDTITQRLQEAIESYVEAADAPRWAIHFDVVDQRRYAASGVTGTARSILDLVFLRTQRGPRPRFTFEAKRLYEKSGEKKYLGPDGLGAFIDGSYRREDNKAGMLGYVQNHTPVVWAAKIEQGMKSEAKSLAVSTGGNWQATSLAPDLQFTYRSRHDRPSVGRQITMYHVLLPFN
jgi:hypothetical protein